MRRWAGVASVLGMLIVFPTFSARAQEEQGSVEIRDNYFLPAETHVLEGGTVTWTNLGGAHSVTSDDNGATFDSSPACFAGLNCMANGDTFSHTFTTAETVTYHCRVHGNAMVGTVVVEPLSSTTGTSSSSTTTTTQPTTSTSTDGTDSLSAESEGSTALSQPPLPQLPSAPHSRALPRAIARSTRADDLRPWALLAIAIAAGTTIAGIVLVRRGRVPFG